MGGLSRKAYQINKFIRSESTPALVLDSGALFFKQPLLTPRAEEAARRTARGISRAVRAMDTRAVGIAPRDLAGGMNFLKQLEQENNLILLSMNLYPGQGNNPVFRPYLLTEAGSLKIAILGLTGNPGDILQDKGFHILPWQAILPETLQKVEKKVDMTILLSSLPGKENEKIARKFKNIHIIFQSGQGGGNMLPVNINNTLLCRTEARGKYMGVLQINWTDSKTWSKPVPEELLKEQNRLDRIQWQIGRMQKRFSEQTVAGNPKYQQLLKDKTRLEQSIIKLKRQKQDTGTQPLCTYTNTFIALRDSLPEDKPVKAIIDQTRREVNRINRKALQKQKKQHREIRQTQRYKNFPAPLQMMAGSRACTGCHPRQTAFYFSTGHAKAWQTLAAQDQQYNPDCLLCHVTLPTYDSMQVRNRFTLNDLPYELQGVGCETCHGPARNHTEAPEKFRPRKPDQSLCLQCHTDERDDNFIFTEKISRIACPND